MGFWAALQFLTILPSPVRRAFRREEMGEALTYFPVVGLLLGLFLWGLDAVLSAALPPLPVNVLLLGAIVILTGAMHVDGFIDTCDGAASRTTIEERLNIMADSRVGAFGVAGGCLLLLLKLAALFSLPSNVRVPALVLMPVVGRWSMVYAVHAYPYARGDSGRGHAFKEGGTDTRMFAGLAITLVIAIAATRGWHGPALLALVFLGVVAFGAYVRSRLGGLTGDSYGAVNEVAEVLTLLVLPILWRVQ
ncbi:MAG: adenosylcobinamide-GDP ribazoletransferase [Dehalococcoidia bacterium]|nr:adenosylcobinamide-GDP ribazoletransferase [Dehalococcoidia bacterium]